jgi:fumarylacetoacetate (FAA) hydrolase family protein
MTSPLDFSSVFPADHADAVLVGRIWIEGQGATLVHVGPKAIHDLSALAPTCSALLELAAPAQRVRAFLDASNAPPLAQTAAVVANSPHSRRVPGTPWLMAPCDLQAIKAAGVTFVSSMLERVIEEQARGDASKATSLRQDIVALIGDDLSRVKPGSALALALKQTLISKGVWSQYLEVGIGVDAEIFTKAQPMSAVGLGAEIGIHPRSDWNNPEPEVVLAVNSQGVIQGASLGNDVNLRDFEGRSALLLGKAKDNNASCAIGPFIRLFDAAFTLAHVETMALAVTVEGIGSMAGDTAPYFLEGHSDLAQISRTPSDLAQQTMGPYHQYPDGFMLFLGTMFAPTQDRFAVGQGFTHRVGDTVRVASAELGALVNQVNFCDKIEPWTYGVGALMRDLAKRGTLA